MRVLWLGRNDEGGCVLHWHKLRLRLREHGVDLAGPGYTPGWERGLRPISSLYRDHDWVVLDDCNATGYVPVQWDKRPQRVAWREHDWHNRQRNEIASRIAPDLVMGCYERDFEKPPNWTLVPQVVDTDWFHANGVVRPFAVGFFGKTGGPYKTRNKALAQVRKRDDAWIGVHGGYWHDGRERNNGRTTFYNENLARALQQVKCLYVAGGNWKGCVLKFFEGAASGCLLIGEKPYGWESYFPRGSMVTCKPEDIHETVDFYVKNEPARRSIAVPAMIHCRKTHSIEARAKQIMEVLGA